MQMSGLLVMSDGTVVEGIGAGAAGIAVGELVFQTGMVGYQEAMTDPSYAGQLLIFTYPSVGNYGVGQLANQSNHIHPRGIIVRDLTHSAGHRDGGAELGEMLQFKGIPALTGVDTRFLTRHTRAHGVVPAALAVGPADTLPSVEHLKEYAGSLDYDTIDFVAECTTPSLIWHPPACPGAPRVAIVDYGAKSAMLDLMLEKGAGVWLVPATATASEILALQPDGILLSNGPGDPAHLDYAVGTVRSLVENARVPVFGICLGHQLIALAAGARTQKMRFGHRGVNQPVLEVATGSVSITTQNHGYVVDPSSIPGEYRVTHTNLNDGTVEGLRHVERPLWGVQWHPEARPGPTDTRGLIDSFLDKAAVAHA